MLNMVWKDILPAVSAYSKALSDAALSKKALSPEIDCRFETEQAKKISALIAAGVARAQDLEYAVQDVKNTSDSLAAARCYRDEVFTAMNELRLVVDELESSTASEYWPYPSYGEILFSVY